MKKKTFIPFEILPESSEVDEEHVLRANLDIEEYKRIRRLLGRVPNKIEFDIVEALWSERCSGKSTKAYLSRLAANSKDQIDLGNGFVLVQKMANVNAEQSYKQTLAKLIGEVIATGARPVVIAHDFNNKIESEIEISLANYCKELEIPSLVNPISITHDCDELNATFLVLGLLKKELYCPPRAIGLKNRVLYVGQATEDFLIDADSNKRFFRACLKAIEEGLVTGSYSIGLAGISHAAMALASHGTTGMLLHLDDVPMKKSSSLNQNLLSESPGRMLLIAEPKKIKSLKELFNDYKICCVDIGSVNGDGHLRIIHNGQEIVQLAATLILENAPRFRLSYRSSIPPLYGPDLKEEIPLSLNKTLSNLQHSYSLEKENFFSSFDPYIGLYTKIGLEEGNSALLNLFDNKKNLAFAMVKESKALAINPEECAKRAFYQALLQLSAQGAQAIGISSVMLASSPNEETITNLKHVIDSLAEMSSRYNIPIISAAVSIKEASFLRASLTISAVGINKSSRYTCFGNARSKDILVLLGDLPTDFLGTERIFNKTTKSSLRSVEPERLEKLMSVIKDCVHHGISSCVSVVANGGLFRSILNIMTKSRLGLTIDFGSEWLRKELLMSMLSEESARVILTVPEHQVCNLMKECAHKVAVYPLGVVEGQKLLIRHEGQRIFEA